MAQPRVLVLDEATSNLDLQSETKIEAALDVLLEDRTAILIAHRLSTAMRADRIVVVDDGRIVEVGSHDELVARGRPLRRDVRHLGPPHRIHQRLELGPCEYASAHLASRTRSWTKAIASPTGMAPSISAPRCRALDA